MGRVFWTDEAASSLARLDPRVQRAIREKASHLKSFPQMYQAAEAPRFLGCRRFIVRPCYVVYYRIWGEENDCFVIATRYAQAGQEELPETD